MKSDLDNFVEDLLGLLIDRAIEGKNRRKGAGIGATNKDFEEGRALAYYEVVSSSISLALAFGLNPETIPVLGFDADAELLS